MNRLLLLTFLLSPSPLFAQRLTGLLLGEETRLPLAHATITAGNQMVQSNGNGLFAIDVPIGTDSVRITCAGYAKYAFKPNRVKKDTLIIYMPIMVYDLKQVNIRSMRDRKADSLRTRADFAKVFNYRAPKLTDAFTRINPYKDVPNDNITARNNTASIVSVDVLKVISMFGTKKAPMSKLQQTLLKEEASNYVDERFSKSRISAITSLKDDSLKNFMTHYRPSITELKQLNDYELMAYIKKCYSEFKTPQKHP